MKLIPDGPLVTGKRTLCCLGLDRLSTGLSLRVFGERTLCCLNFADSEATRLSYKRRKHFQVIFCNIFEQESAIGRTRPIPSNYPASGEHKYSQVIGKPAVHLTRRYGRGLTMMGL